MKKSINLFLILLTSVIYSQNNFEYKKDFTRILLETKNNQSNIFYEKQLKKFVENDSLQSDYETLSLMIGYTEKKEYKPYLDIFTGTELYNLNEEKKYTEVIEKATNILNLNPFHIKALQEISYALKMTNNKSEAIKYDNRKIKIFKAMAYSCNGDSKKYPIFALAPKDGQYYIKYFLRRKLGAMGSGFDKDNNFIDILEAKSESESITYNFIIEHAKKKMFEK